MSLRSNRVAAPLALLALAAFVLRASAGEIEGVVYLRSGNRSVPLAGVFVEAARNGRNDRPAVTRTGRDGRYRLSALLPGTYTVRAARDGYGAAEAAGPSATKAVVECARNCPESPLYFELVALGVVSGVAIDALGEPVEGAKVMFGAADPPAEPRFVETDDRGRFRFAGLRPGQYTLRAEANRGTSRLAASGTDIELAGGETTQGIRLVLQPRHTFEISGEIQEIGAGGDVPGRISLRSLSPHGRNYSTHIGGDNAFRFEDVAEGRYLGAASFRQIVERPIFLGVLDVISDLSGLVLSPLPTATLDFNVRFSNGRTAPIALRLVSNDRFPERIMRLGEHDSRVAVSEVIPGSYLIRVDSPDFYVETVRRGLEILPAESMDVPPGTVKIEVVIGSVSAGAVGNVRKHGGAVAMPKLERESTQDVSAGTAAK